MESANLYIDPEIQQRVSRLLNRSQKHMGDALGIEFTSFKSDEVKATMPVSDNTVQPFGILHGGASVALAETLASIGAWLNIDDGEGEKSAVGIEINANHVRSVGPGGRVHGISVPVHRGRQIHVWETRIYDSDEKLVCISRCTLAILGR